MRQVPGDVTRIEPSSSDIDTMQVCLSELKTGRDSGVYITAEALPEQPDISYFLELFKSRGHNISLENSAVIQDLTRMDAFSAEVHRFPLNDRDVILKFIGGATLMLDVPGVQNARDYMRWERMVLEAGRAGMKGTCDLIGVIEDSAHLDKIPSRSSVAVLREYVDGTRLDAAISQGLISEEETREKLIDYIENWRSFGFDIWDCMADNFFLRHSDSEIILTDGSALWPVAEIAPSEGEFKEPAAIANSIISTAYRNLETARQ